jgi:hypothetical protein
VYERGFYFEPEDELLIDGLVLNTSFTLEFYVRVMTKGTLLGVFDALETVFSFGVYKEDTIEDLSVM